MAYTDYYNDLKTNRLLGIYGFYGPESFVIKSMIDLTKEKLIAKGLEELDFVFVSGKSLDFSEAKELVELLPFGSEKRVVVIENPDFFDTDKWGKNRIENFLELHSNSNILTLLLFDKIDKKRYGFKALSKIGKLVEFERLDRKELINWIRKSKFLDKNIADSAAVYIANESGYLEKNSSIDLFAIKSLLEIVASSTTANTIELNDVKNYLESSPEPNVFKWRDALINGNINQSFSYLSSLIEADEHPIKLFSIFQSHVRELYKYSLLKKTGMNMFEISKLLKKQDFIVRDYERLLSKYSTNKISKLVRVCVNTDDLIKVGSVDGKLALQKLAFEIAEIIR